MNKKTALLTLLTVAFFLVQTASVFAYGNSNNNNNNSSNNSNPTAPQCSKDKPNKPVLYEPNHPLLPRSNKAGEIILKWLPVDKATKYTVSYGMSTRNYIYGAPDVGNVDQFTVGALTPGQTYYFSVKAVNDCMPSDYSNEWGVKVGGGGMAYIFQNILGAKAKVEGTVVASEEKVLGESKSKELIPTEDPLLQDATPVVEKVNQEDNGGNIFQQIWKAIKGVDQPSLHFLASQ